MLPISWYDDVFGSRCAAPLFRSSRTTDGCCMIESDEERTLRCDVCQAVREQFWTVADCVAVKNIVRPLDNDAASALGSTTS
jgi:hypothetical protein